MVDAADSKSAIARCVGSSPTARTKVRVVPDVRVGRQRPGMGERPTPHRKPDTSSKARPPRCDLGFAAKSWPLRGICHRDPPSDSRKVNQANALCGKSGPVSAKLMLGAKHMGADLGRNAAKFGTHGKGKVSFPTAHQIPQDGWENPSVLPKTRQFGAIFVSIQSTAFNQRWSIATSGTGCRAVRVTLRRDFNTFSLLVRLNAG